MKIPWLSDQEIKAVCWTLIHSLWIGLILAGLAGLILTNTKKSAPKLRYQLLSGVLLLFVIGTVYTLIHELALDYPQVISHKPDLSGGTTIPALFSGMQAGSRQFDEVNRLIYFLNQQSGWIFMIWFIFFALKTMKLIGGFGYTHLIRRRKVHQVGPEWKIKIKTFGRKLGINKTVSLLQSELVKVPVTIGFFKPVILLPLGMILQLPPGQVDTILWHELSHILRRDYLVNIVQRMLETVFFFNPALLWLSSLIREEREACCDDLVLMNALEKKDYLEVLIAFQDMTGMPGGIQGGLAMAISLRRHELRDRLKRMVNQENKNLSGLEKWILLSGMVLLSAFTFFPKENSGASMQLTCLNRDTLPNINLSFSSIRYKAQDSDRANNEIMATDEKGIHYHITVTGGQLAALEIDDAKIPENKLAGYYFLLDEINKTLDRKQLARGKRINNAKFQWTDKKKAPHHADISGDQERVRGVIAALVDAKVVSGQAAVEWFGLSEDELIVNGQKQPESLHQQLKSQFDIRPNYGLYYGPVKMTGTGVFIEKGEL